MGYLYSFVVLAAWTGAAFVYRQVVASRTNRFLMLAAMGFAALGLDVALMAATGANPARADRSQLILGACLGLGSAATIPSFLAAVARGDLATTWTISTLAFAATSLICIFYPGEPARASGLAGLALAAGAVTLLGADMRRRQAARPAGSTGRGWGFFMTTAFLTNVVCLYLFRLASYFAPDDLPHQKLTFLAAAHAVLAAASLGAWFCRRGGPGRPALLAGALAGTALFTGGLFSMLALSTARLSAYIFFPLATGGSAVLVMILSIVFLAERPGWPGRIGLAAGAAALVLLGWAA